MKIVFLFYEGMTSLDVIGPHEILCRLPDAVIYRVAVHRGIVKTDSGNLLLTAEYSLSEVSEGDILVVPGAGSATILTPEVREWIRSIHQKTKWTTSVCTGSLILGAAGLLRGLKATSHWAVLDRLPFWGAQPMNKRIVQEGKIITAAGVSAGIDMALSLVKKTHGLEMA